MTTSLQVFENRAKSNPQLGSDSDSDGVCVTLMRPAVLDGGKYEKKGYIKDFTATKKDSGKDSTSYNLLKSLETRTRAGGKIGMYCGRQHVAEAFLDVSEEFCTGGMETRHTNTEWSIFDK